MNGFKIACFDVYYYSNYAKACCIVFEVNPIERIIATYSEKISPVCEYIPGKFYKRELPCIIEVYKKINEDIDLIIIDGYTLIGSNKGLGGYLYEYLNKSIPVIGVAKTYFYGVSNYVEVYRGNSKKPLYVTSIGIDLIISENIIKELSGEFRIPYILREVDKMTKNKLLNIK